MDAAAMPTRPVGSTGSELDDVDRGEGIRGGKEGGGAAVEDRNEGGGGRPELEGQSL